ncbi:hypothetical protein HJC23_000430 [Cyclotella cryptica]|uniref:Prolyl 4-hydroxylase alpha subunit Fe(2+) 2OG dioxygenase domain-containing protein n=1 Tax=Cyclotella cryptica TaxID=29204 RepID=A0ABD3QAJ9_9STRA|eukprot:CCRYP_007169-RB/>CCRYP_007169-RB protein AED:0.06 eAED:0.06 QI:645/1/1/1/0.5/0.33/3/343/672
MTARPTKRKKTDHTELIREAWDCYRNFIDAEENNDDSDGDTNAEEDDEYEDQDNGAIDELLELIDLLEPLKVQPFDMLPTSDSSAIVKSLNVKSLLPMLISMSYLHLANYAISYVLKDAKADGTTKEFLLGFESPMEYFEHSLRFWPTNPAAMSMCANYDRMNCWSSTEEICERYCKAAQYAGAWRQIALNYFQVSSEDVEDEADGMNAKEWVELLIMNGALGVDYISEEEDNEADEVKDSGEYSASEVEATASFMSGLLLSVLGKHDEALQYLRKFNLSHRIHPNVWKMAQSPNQDTLEAAPKNDADTSIYFEPRIYHNEVNAGSDIEENNPKGILPPTIYKKLCDLFSPTSNYWTESDYNHRGYYSYFIDLEHVSSNGKSVRERPTNLMEDVIVNYLLPLAERTLQENHKSEDEIPRIVGAEWWCHTRQLGANLGHQIHFDTDESLLGREKKVTHPIVSSVLYLTGGTEDTEGTDSPKAGATIVFDQTPDSKEVASKAWVCHPKDNAFMNFPGNMLHGVLPCTGGRVPKKNEEDVILSHNRLTFMVGFWTRNVTEGMGEHRTLYGPCGPLPPTTEEHSWVKESQMGYDESAELETRKTTKCDRMSTSYEVLPYTSPAWDEFVKMEGNKASIAATSSSPTLDVPKGLDHRYFVLNAPHCFSDSLFQNEDCF